MAVQRSTASASSSFWSTSQVETRPSRAPTKYIIDARVLRTERISRGTVYRNLSLLAQTTAT
jgi:hypothetical protein